MTGRVNVLMRITVASNKEREETSNSHTHMQTPQIEQTGNSPSLKSYILRVSAQTTSSVTSLMFEKFLFIRVVFVDFAFLICFVLFCFSLYL